MEGAQGYIAVIFLLRASLAINCAQKYLLTHGRVGFELRSPGFQAELYTLMVSATIARDIQENGSYLQDSSSQHHSGPKHEIYPLFSVLYRTCSSQYLSLPFDQEDLYNSTHFAILLAAAPGSELRSGSLIASPILTKASLAWWPHS